MAFTINGLSVPSIFGYGDYTGYHQIWRFPLIVPNETNPMINGFIVGKKMGKIWTSMMAILMLRGKMIQMSSNMLHFCWRISRAMWVFVCPGGVESPHILLVLHRKLNKFWHPWKVSTLTTGWKFGQCLFFDAGQQRKAVALDLPVSLEKQEMCWRWQV